MDFVDRNFSKMKVQELRDLCKRNSIDSGGTKPILVQRLKDHIEKSQQGHNTDHLYSAIYHSNSDLSEHDVEKKDNYLGNLVIRDPNEESDKIEHRDGQHIDNDPQYIYSDDEEGTDYEDEMLPEDYEKISSDDENFKISDQKKQNIMNEANSTIDDHSGDMEKYSLEKNAEVKNIQEDSNDTLKNHKHQRELIVPPSNDADLEPFEDLTLDVRNDTFQLDASNSDLHFIISNSNCLQGCNMIKNGLSHFWCSSTTNFGVKPGQKVFFECKYIRNLDVNLPVYEIPEHALRVGFSVKNVTHLGDSLQSVGFESNGKLYHNSKVAATTTSKFTIGDTVGVFLDMTCDPALFSISINGVAIDVEARIPLTLSSYSEMIEKHVEDLDEQTTERYKDVLYPYIFFKNVEFSVNFTSPPTVDKLENGYDAIDSISVKPYIVPNSPPLSVGECEVIMMSGIVGCGKTTWVSKFLKNNPSKQYFIIGRSALYERWRVIGQPRKVRLPESVAADAITKMMSLAAKRPCCCILDQSNCYTSSRKKRIEVFSNYPSIKAIVLTPHLSEYEYRLSKAKRERSSLSSDDRSIRSSDVLEYKKTYVLPKLEEGFTEIFYDGSSLEEAQVIVNDYRLDAKKTDELNKYLVQRKKLLRRIDSLSAQLKKIKEERSPSHKPPMSLPKKAPSISSPRKSSIPTYTSRTNRRSVSPRFDYGSRNNIPRPPYPPINHIAVTLPRKNDSRKRNRSPSMLPPPPPPPSLPRYRESEIGSRLSASPGRDSYRSTIVRTTYSSSNRNHNEGYQGGIGYVEERSRSQRMPPLTNPVNPSIVHEYRSRNITYDARMPMHRENMRTSANNEYNNNRSIHPRPSASTSRVRVDNSRRSSDYRGNDSRSMIPTVSHADPNWGRGTYPPPEFSMGQRIGAPTGASAWDSSRQHTTDKTRGEYGGFSEKSPIRASRNSGRSSYRSRYP